MYIYKKIKFIGCPGVVKHSSSKPVTKTFRRLRIHYVRMMPGIRDVIPQISHNGTEKSLTYASFS